MHIPTCSLCSFFVGFRKCHVSRSYARFFITLGFLSSNQAFFKPVRQSLCSSNFSTHNLCCSHLYAIYVWWCGSLWVCSILVLNTGNLPVIFCMQVIETQIFCSGFTRVGGLACPVGPSAEWHVDRSDGQELQGYEKRQKVSHNNLGRY